MQNTWWEGPNWLKSAQEEWPTSAEIIFVSEEIEQEKRKLTDKKCMINNNYNENLFSHHFSQYRKIVCLVSWVFRFLHECRLKENMKLERMK